MSGDPSVLLLAGEPSGDLHGARVAGALRDRWPRARLLGLGGERMAAQGVELLAPLDELAVMGFAEVALRIPYFLRLERRLDRLLRTERVDLVLPIDYPGFNLRLARRASRRGVPVVYYIAPQLWAWKQGRASKLARYTRHVAVILPFEVEILREAGARVSFVGHPLLDRSEPVPDRRRFAAEQGFDPDRPILALFPGSRRQEIERHGGLFAEVAARLRAARPELQVGVARASGIAPEALSGGEVRVVDDGRGLLRHATAALVKSGTTTLEAAIEGTPFVTAYRTHPITFFLARRLVRVEHIALANLVAGRRVVPELLQGDATADRLEKELAPLLDDTPTRRRVVEGLEAVRERLGDAGAAERVARIAGSVLEETRRTAEA